MRILYLSVSIKSVVIFYQDMMQDDYVIKELVKLSSNFSTEYDARRLCDKKFGEIKSCNSFVKSKNDS